MGLIKLIVSIIWLSAIIGLLIMCIFVSRSENQYMEQLELCEKETSGDLCERNECMREREERVSEYMILECIEQNQMMEMN